MSSTVSMQNEVKCTRDRLFLLWTTDIDVPVKENAIAAKIEGLTLEGEVDSDGTGQLPMELGDFDSAKIEDTKKSISDIIRSL